MFRRAVAAEVSITLTYTIVLLDSGSMKLFGPSVSQSKRMPLLGSVSNVVVMPSCHVLLARFALLNHVPRFLPRFFYISLQISARIPLDVIAYCEMSATFLPKDLDKIPLDHVTHHMMSSGFFARDAIS